jgi:hypothetical protein
MAHLIKTITDLDIPGGFRQISFKNQEGKFHRLNGPAVIWMRGDCITYCYYQNGTFYRPSKNGKEQPAIIKKTPYEISYTYFNGNAYYAERLNVNLPYRATYKFNGDYKLIYPSHTIIGDPHFKKIVYHSGGHVSYCCEGLAGLQCLNGVQTEIPLYLAIAQVRHVQRRGFSEWPLNELL